MSTTNTPPLPPGGEEHQDEIPHQDAPMLSERNHFLVANNPLPENTFPPNVPSVDTMKLAIGATPIMLNTPEDLKRQLDKFVRPVSNFAQVSLPANATREAVFPTFTRFNATRFSNLHESLQSIEPSSSRDQGALYDMSYPITLNVTDGSYLPIPGLPLNGILDSTGYPLFYGPETLKKRVSAGTSGAFYSLQLSALFRRNATDARSAIPDSATVKAWASMFLLTSDKDAQAILQRRVLSQTAGDNHIALLVKAYLAYLDSTAGALAGVEMTRNRFSAGDFVINVASRDGWPAQMLSSTHEIVNVIGLSTATQELFAHLCFNQPTVYATKTENDVATRTLFSSYEMRLMNMTCLCDFDAYSLSRTPAFFGKPNIVLGCIEEYVTKHGLQQQANDALQIALLWPTLYQLGAHISLPKPNHAADWFGGEVDPKITNTPYPGLISSSPFVVMASTLASSWAMRSQIYDLVTLLAQDRHDWALTKSDVEECATWLATHASTPERGWSFLFSHQFMTTPSFLYLTGLSVQTMDWPKLLRTFSWQEVQFPAHLRLLQPFWVPSSVCCNLPWGSKAWIPDLRFFAPRITATPDTLMRLLRLGLLVQQHDPNGKPVNARKIHPVLARKGTYTLTFEKLPTEQLRVIKDSGIVVSALCSPPADDLAGDIIGRFDPSDGREVREQWVMSGLLQNVQL